MRKIHFRQWLAEGYAARNGMRLARGTQASRFSNCKRIERFEGDLDEHYTRDEMTSLIERLEGIGLRHKIPINGDPATGTSTLRSAALLYQKFCRDGGRLMTAEPSVAGRTRHSSTAITRGWPSWDAPSESEILTLARIVTKYVRFLRPDIVAAIVEDNEQRSEEWLRLLGERGVDGLKYLWPSSPCTWPGVRRHAGKSEIAQFREPAQAGVRDAICLDDNTFPKHLWSFCMTGGPFRNLGPSGYSLAHLADHKRYKNRGFEEIRRTDGSNVSNVWHGLYTSAANTVFVPAELLRPTDSSPLLRNLLQRRGAELYDPVCNVLPPGHRFNNLGGFDWRTGAFEWGETSGDPKYLPSFLAFRRTQMEKLLTIPPVFV